MIYAYPCEGVYGLGCDPDSKIDVYKLCDLKKRSTDKGLILISGVFEHFEKYINHLDKQDMDKLKKPWPGPHTWLVKANENVPEWIKGNSDLVALRHSSHPEVIKLTMKIGTVLTSTSANISNDPPAMSADEVRKIFGNQVKVISGEVGNFGGATPIQNLETGEWIRK